jgi:hypothetical protein
LEAPVAENCMVQRWQWTDPSFAYAYPPSVRTFLARFRNPQAEARAYGLLIDFMRNRVLDCIGYEETLKWPDRPFTALSLHVFPPDDDGLVYGGFAFEWKPRQIHAMALWHRDDPMDAARFVAAAVPETAAMTR